MARIDYPYVALLQRLQILHILSKRFLFRGELRDEQRDDAHVSLANLCFTDFSDYRRLL